MAGIGIILVAVFVGVFALVALPLVAVQMGPSRRRQQATATLDSALASSRPDRGGEQPVDLRKHAHFSSIPWLNRQLDRLALGPRIHALLDQAAIGWSVGRMVLVSAVCLVATAYLINLRLHAGLVSLAVGLAAAAIPAAWVAWRRQQRFERFEQELPEALDLMVSGLKAGHSLNAVMGLVAREVGDPLGGEFRLCYEEQNYGVELKVALDNLLVRVPLQDLRIVATAILIQKESGGNLAEVLGKASGSIRERFRLRRQVSVHTAQGRLTGIILAVLPMALGGALYLANPQMMSVLWTTPIGLRLLWISGGMTVVGALLIRRIVRLDI